MPIKILFASRLVREKGVDILIELMKSCEGDRELRGQIEWHICSDGALRDTIVEFTKKHQNSIYHGQLSPDNIRKLYKKVDILFMPSRFLEMFGLTALEAITYGVHVCGIRKGGLVDFIPPELAIDEHDPIESTKHILKNIIKSGFPEIPDGERFSLETWTQHTNNVLGERENILIVHDYKELVGGAESHVVSLIGTLSHLGRSVKFFGYTGKLTSIKRKWLFFTSLLGWKRGQELKKELLDSKPEIIWMHSVARYVGIWGVYQISKYAKTYPQTQILLSHHDLGYISAFPSRVEHEEDIPKDHSLVSFLYKKNSILGLFSIGKWLYTKILISIFPKNMEHIIFSEFMKKHIQNHFGRKIIHIIPHTILTMDRAHGR